MSGFQSSGKLINKELANRSHLGTSFDPERRAEQEIDGFKAEVQAVYNELSRYAGTEKQKEFLIAEMERFQSEYAEKRNACLAAKGRCFSVMITGASGFNNRAHDKANSSENKRYEEARDFKDRTEKAIIRELKKLDIEEKGGEIPALEMKLKQHEDLQEAMKVCNSIIRRKGSDEEKIKAIIEATKFSETTTRKLITPDFCGRLGFTYQLQNNNHNINSMRKRLSELQKKESIPTSDISFKGGHIVDNAEEDRVQIVYDSKPDQATIDKLKSQGWHWSPSNMAWQRKRTNAAMYSAKRITGIDNPSYFLGGKS